MKQLFTISILFSFISAALAFLVPLYLIDKNIDLATIGIVLSIAPLVFLVMRVFFAAWSDIIGTKTISLVYSASNILAIILYLLSASPLGFALANLAEGLRNSGFWAIVRTETLNSSKEKNPGQMLAHFSASRQLADGMGRLFFGFALAYLAFSGSFLVLSALSLVLFYLVLTSPGLKPFFSGRSRGVAERIFKKRPISFWKASALQLLLWLPYNMLLSFLLPVYLRSSLELGYYEIGAMIAFLAIVTATASFLSMRLNFSKPVLISLTFLTVPALILFPFSSTDLVIPLVLFSLGIGCGSILSEYIIADQIFRSKDVSTDIGMIYAPLKFTEVLFLALAGVVVVIFGYAPLFLFCACINLVFVFAAFKFMN